MHMNSLLKLYCFFIIICVGLTLMPRQKAPYFKGSAVMPDGKVKALNLDYYKGKYLILLFYPFDFTYVCPTEILSFSNSVSKFNELGAEVLAISTDSVFVHMNWRKVPIKEGGVGQDLQIPLYADNSKDMSKKYGVLVEDENDELYGAALRGLFIIDTNQIVRSFTINDAPVGRSVEETLRLIQAFQYADKYGEVCPANWKPGDKTIKPSQDEKLDYFKTIEYPKKKDL